MNREEARKSAEVTMAFANGKKIQKQRENGEWIDCDSPLFDWASFNYRIKPEPKYRPFRTQEECWEEMHKHPDFGWVKDSIGNGYKQILRIWDKGIDVLVYTNISNTFELAFRLYTFIDDAPFGMKDYR